MSETIFSKAREIGQMIIESEQSIRLSDAIEAISLSSNDVNKSEFERAEKENKKLVDQAIGIINTAVFGDADGVDEKQHGCKKCNGGCCK